jgi:hypothetical protein
MMTTPSSLSGQPAHPVSPLLADPLLPEIQTHVLVFNYNRTGQDELEARHQELSARLLAAGFRFLQKRPLEAELKERSGRFLISIYSVWRHPDCSTPFYATLRVAVQTHKALRGEVQFGLKISENPGAPGILGDDEFEDSCELSYRKELASAQAWVDHVTPAFSRITKEEFLPMLDRGMAYLEGVSTP